MKTYLRINNNNTHIGHVYMLEYFFYKRRLQALVTLFFLSPRANGLCGEHRQNKEAN